MFTQGEREADIFNRPIPTRRQSESTPDYSPNGSKLLFFRTRRGPEVFKMNSDGTNKRALTHLPKPALDPDWATNPGP